MPLQPTRSFTGDGLVPSRDPNDARVESIRLAPGRYAQGQAIGFYAVGAAASAVQTAARTGTPTGGSTRWAVDGKPTSPIAFNASAADVQAILEALPNVGVGNVSVALATNTYTVTYQGALANMPIPTLTLFSNSLTGGTTPGFTFASTTTGRSAGLIGGLYDDGAADGRQVCRGFLKYPTEVALNGTHAVGSSIFGEVTQDGKQSAPVYVGGTFFTSALLGLDPNGIADVGRLITGTAATDPGAELRMS